MEECYEYNKFQEEPEKQNETEMTNSDTDYLAEQQPFNSTRARCIKNGFSITRFNIDDWHDKNKRIFEESEKVMNDTDWSVHFAKANASNMLTHSSKMQQENSLTVKSRVKQINQVKIALERAISEIKDEITALEEDEIRTKNALLVLKIPESITRECISIRACRLDTELIFDGPEEELIKEINLISEIKLQINNYLSEIKEQRIENTNARHRLESDWSAKCEAYDIDARVWGLNNDSKILMSRPGVTITSAEQSTERFWKEATEETLKECEDCRVKSINLRSRLTSMLLCAARDLRDQADKTERAFSSRINCTKQVVQTLENELEKCLKKQAENESCIEKLIKDIQSFDVPIKVVQTRLHYRHYRPHYENCSDRVQSQLKEELHDIEGGVSKLSEILNECQMIKNELNQNRQQLEREIFLKQKTIFLDDDRCAAIRSHFPSATALSGFIST